MDVFFETQSGSKFCVELGYRDTVLEVKQKIEKSQRIPVSKQTISFDGMVLQDDLDVEKCQIVHKTRLQLFVSPDHKPNHNQTEQSPAPSNSTEEIIEGSAVTVQTEQAQDIIEGHQDSTVTVRGLQTEESSPSNPTEKIIDSHTVTVQMEQSPSSNSVKEFINNPESPLEVKSYKKRMVVYVLLYCGESKAGKGIPVAVTIKMNDNVKELRNELVKIEERGELNLPQEGYFLIHKNRLLNENHSFLVAGVRHNETIEILPKHLTRGSFTFDS